MNENMLYLLLVFIGLPAAFGFILGAGLMWAASRFFSFRRHGLLAAIKVTAQSFFTGLLLSGIALVPFYYDMAIVSLALAPLCLVSSLAIFAFLVKRTYGEDLKTTLLACFAVIAVGAALFGAALIALMTAGLMINRAFNPLGL